MTAARACLVDGCSARSSMALCPAHWALVPPELRRLIRESTADAWQAHGELLAGRTPARVAELMDARAAWRENLREVARVVHELERDNRESA